MRVINSDHALIEQNEFFHWSKALAISSNFNVVVRGNDMHSTSNDTIVLTGNDTVLIEGNWLHDLNPTPGAHIDMIQLFNYVGAPRASNITIKGNFLDAGTGTATESIFMRNNMVDSGQGSFEEYAYHNILIEDNVIYNDHVHGITVGETDGLVIRNNTLLHDTYVSSGPGWTPRIITKLNSDDSLNVTVENNIVYGDGYGTNFGTQNTDPNGENYYGDLFVNPLGAESPSLADLRAVSGGLIETLGVGAEMTRSDIDITLEAGPATMVSR